MKRKLTFTLEFLLCISLLSITACGGAETPAVKTPVTIVIKPNTPQVELAQPTAEQNTSPTEAQPSTEAATQETAASPTNEPATQAPAPGPTAAPTTQPPTPIQVQVNLFPISQSGKWGFIDLSGNVVIAPQYDNVYVNPRPGENTYFPEGFIPVQLNGKWGYIDTKGTMVIQPQFDLAHNFSGGLALVASGNEQTYKFGYIDTSGKFVVPVQFQGARDYSEGLAAILMGDPKTGKWGYLNDKSALVINADYLEAWDFREGFAAIKSSDGKYGYIDAKGTVVIKPQFEITFGFSEGLANIYLNGKSGFIDKTGATVISPQFDAAYEFSEGLAAVRIKDRQGYIDKTGKMVIEAKFAPCDLGWFRDGLASITVLPNNKCAYIDKTGGVVIPPQFDNATSFLGGLALVQVNWRNAYIEKTGKIVWQEQFAELKQTQLIKFSPEIPTDSKQGMCNAHSQAVARPDAWSCTVDKETYDPCFTAADGQTVVCGAVPPMKIAGFKLQLTSPLPLSAPVNPPTPNQAFLVELIDSTICGFATGTPVTAGDKKVRFVCTDQTTLLGDLTAGPIWTADRGQVIHNNDNTFTLQQSSPIQIRTVWQ